MNTPPLRVGGSSGISTGGTDPTQRQETGPEITQRTRDNAPVQADKVSNPKGRTLEELHPLENAGRSSPTFRHHENQRPTTVEEACEAIKAHVAKEEKETIAVIDAFSEAFDKGMDDLTKELANEFTSGVRKVRVSMDRMNDNLKGLNQQLESYNNKLADFGKRFNAGREKERATEQSILDSLAQSNASLTQINAMQKTTTHIVEEGNKKAGQLLEQLRANQKNSSTQTSFQENPPLKRSTAEILAQLNANNEALDRKRKEQQ